MVYLGFDVGGSSVKYALIDETGNFLQKGNFSTPGDLDSFYEGLKEVRESLSDQRRLREPASACLVQWMKSAA